MLIILILYINFTGYILTLFKPSAPIIFNANIQLQFDDDIVNKFKNQVLHAFTGTNVVNIFIVVNLLETQSACSYLPKIYPLQSNTENYQQ